MAGGAAWDGSDAGVAAWGDVYEGVDRLLAVMFSGLIGVSVVELLSILDPISATPHTQHPIAAITQSMIISVWFVGFRVGCMVAPLSR
jgi:hypothetical protein